MASADLLLDGFGRVHELVHQVVDGLSRDELGLRVDEEANSIAWLVWHLTRVQDDHLADAADSEQVWTDAGWADRFGLPLDPADTGYGHKPADVAQLAAVPGEQLIAYHDAVHERTRRWVRTLTDDDLPRIVDERWNPPVTLGVRLISVISDGLQHIGQAAFVKGILLRR